MSPQCLGLRPPLWNGEIKAVQRQLRAAAAGDWLQSVCSERVSPGVRLEGDRGAPRTQLYGFQVTRAHGIGLTPSQQI